MNPRIIGLFCFVWCFGIVSLQGQRTIWVETERPSQTIIFNDTTIWDRADFFTLPTDRGYHKACVRESGYLDTYSFIHKDLNKKFTCIDKLPADKTVLPLIEIGRILLPSDSIRFKTHTLNYSTYLEDLYHDDVFLNYPDVADKEHIKNNMVVDPELMDDLLNHYAKRTRRSVPFTIDGRIHDIELYEIEINDSDAFIQVELQANWGMIDKYKVKTPRLTTKARSGQFPIITKEHRDEVIKMALHDAILKSMMYSIVKSTVFIRS